MVRIRQRLDKLAEKHLPSAEDSDLHGALVDLLAKRDAIFWPWREHSPTPRAEIRRRQQEYISRTAGVKLKASGQEDWKTVHELRKRLIDAGLVEAVYSGGEVVSVILSMLGEAIARELCCERHLIEALVVEYAELVRLHEQTGKRWVTESELLNNGEELIGDSLQWERKTERMLPLLVAGLVDANCDLEGRVAYCVSGNDLPVIPIPSHRMSDDISEWSEIGDVAVVDCGLARFDESWHHRYIASFDAERSYLQHVQPRDPSAIVLPLARLV